ncbi:hydroxyethylthiazole kinase [Natronincola peptidivorans]|uniref:Hydroxyethylthiazole kinase n=1 Tax=Natronincola peptidivorans TaxID=426128 RepID=A0A1H9Y5I2_9FIRM|nr:hydroxyethylthiazole kinase [Natronincola peptidivorans]SES64100.1 hydroxyethylthiazole kinase [Natronincola peptidivorans]
MKEFVNCLKAVKADTPLVQAITNYVTINDCANILLSVGASPAMCEAADEAYEFSQISSAIYLNIGTFTKEQELAMLLAVKGAAKKNIPVVLDPVGCGAIPRRIEYINKLRKFGKIHVVKGNLGEIKSLLGVKSKVRGVDSIDDGEDGIAVCKELANQWDCIVAATGKIDIITDGQKVGLIKNGTEMLTKITGAGCMVGALTAGFCGANDNLLAATMTSHLVMTLAGEKAVEGKDGNLPGSFRIKLFDEISLVDENTIYERGQIEWL